MKVASPSSPRTPQKRSSSFLKVFKKGPNASGSTAPNTPDEEGGVTVLANEYDPSSDISALTDAHIHSPLRNGFVCGGGGDDSRAVTFANPPTSPGGYPSANARSPMRFEEKKESDDVMSKTLAYLDEFCADPRVAGQPPGTVSSPSARKSNRLQHPEWGREPSLDDDDDTTSNPSMLSVSTYSADPLSQSFLTSTVGTAPINQGRGSPGAALIPPSPSHDHENFEVVLDPSSIANDEATVAKRRWPFLTQKRGGDSGELEQQPPPQQQRQNEPQQQQQQPQQQQRQQPPPPPRKELRPPQSQESNPPQRAAGRTVDPAVAIDGKEGTESPGGEDAAENKGKNDGGVGSNNGDGKKKNKTLVKRLWKSCTTLPLRTGTGKQASGLHAYSPPQQRPHLAASEDAVLAASLQFEGQDFLHQQQRGRKLDFEPIAEENEDDVEESRDESGGGGSEKADKNRQSKSAAAVESAWNSIFASITAAFDPDAGGEVAKSSNDVSASNADTSAEEEAKDTESKTKGETAASNQTDAAKEALASGSKANRRKTWGGFKSIKNSTKALVKKKKKAGSSKGKAKNQSKAVKEPAHGPRSLAEVAAAAGVAQKPRVQWKAVTDPSSGKTYYYHRKTRETTWTKPAELRQYELALKRWMEASAVDNDAQPARTQRATELPGAISHEETSNLPSSRSDTWPKGVPNKDKTVSSGSELKRLSTPPESSTVANAVPDSRPPKAKEPQKSPNQEEPSESASTNPMSSMQVPSNDTPFAKPDPTKSEPRADWETRKEVERLVKCLPPADTVKSVDQLMNEYKGREDVLLNELRAKLESQPFDEPMSSGAAAYPHPPRSPHRFGTRTMTHVSKASANTRSSALTDRTEKVKNTGKGKFFGAPAAETFSTSTSLSSKHDEDMNFGGSSSPARRIPSRVPVPRERQLMVEELTDARLSAESYEGNGEKRGRIVRGRAKEPAGATDYYDGDNETEEEGVTSAYENDTYGTDSVSALSENDTDFLNRKDNFEQARRRALDDAIEREDWDLAAALSEGMRAANLPGGYERAHSSWNQSELDKFIANNDWNAVKSYIARMNEMSKKPTKDNVIESPRTAKAQPKKVPNASPANKKSIGARSRLQHKELLSESSWTSDSRSSYESDDSDSEI